MTRIRALIATLTRTNVLILLACLSGCGGAAAIAPCTAAQAIAAACQLASDAVCRATQDE